MDRKQLADRIKELREAAGLTQGGLAEACGWDWRAVADLERGRGWPAWDTMCAIADAIKIGVEQFRVPPAETPKRGRGRPRKVSPPSAPQPSSGA